ncbi:transcription factor MYB1R1-like [Nicotiana tabacum]|uniref:Transcription factor MYB1R1-like n=1 Tax=Nicotiana tabacum TaxID=4097 RepID=A0A1S4DBF2_TOBAC|nr:PREDICTED: transcription factor MYB1R1-like [Nicotiana tabacum]
MAWNCTLCGGIGHNQRTCSEKGKSIKLFGVKISTTTSKKDSANYGRKIKKAIPWTEDEHRLFLKGLEIHGKSNWAKISKDFLPNRTHIQIASHAQKYFMRLAAASDERKNRKKPSIFDVHLEEIIISERETRNVSEHTIQEHAQETGGNIPTSQVPCERAIVPLEIIQEHAQDHQEPTAISSERNHSNNFFIIPCFVPVSTWLNLPVFHSFAIN